LDCPGEAGLQESHLAGKRGSRIVESEGMDPLRKGALKDGL